MKSGCSSGFKVDLNLGIFIPPDVIERSQVSYEPLPDLFSLLLNIVLEALGDLFY